jgi:hypothetical protein
VNLQKLPAIHPIYGPHPNKGLSLNYILQFILSTHQTNSNSSHSTTFFNNLLKISKNPTLYRTTSFTSETRPLPDHLLKNKHPFFPISLPISHLIHPSSYPSLSSNLYPTKLIRASLNLKPHSTKQLSLNLFSNFENSSILKTPVSTKNIISFPPPPFFYYPQQHSPSK